MREEMNNGEALVKNETRFFWTGRALSGYGRCKQLSPF